MHFSLTSRCLRQSLILSRTQKIISFSTIRSYSAEPTSKHKLHDLNPQPDSLSFDPNTVTETLSSYGNDWRKAHEFFTWVESQCQFQHTTETYNGMLDILGKYFKFELSWDLINRMKQNPHSLPDHTTFRIMFKRYASAHLVKDAMDTYNRLEEFGLKDETSYCNLIDGLCEHKHVIEAHDLVLWNKDLGFDKKTKIHNIILRGWMKMEWWSKCRDYWLEMDRIGVRKDLHSYSVYMDILSKSGKPLKAVQLYREMKKKRIKLDVVAYNIVVRAIGVSDGVDFSVRLLREMRDLGCEPSVVTYNTIIKLFCKNGRYMEAFAMLDKMSKKGCVPDVITYHCLFGCMEKPKEILSLFDRMIGSGVRPRLDTYVMLMRKFGRWGFLRPVFVFWKKMEEHGCSPNEAAYNALIDALVEKDMLDMARKYEEEMLAKGLSAKQRKELGENWFNKRIR